MFAKINDDGLFPTDSVHSCASIVSSDKYKKEQARLLMEFKEIANGDTVPLEILGMALVREADLSAMRAL